MVGEKRPRVWKGIRLTAEYNALVKDAEVKHPKDGKQKTIDGVEEFVE
jgi:hypothetical protein